MATATQNADGEAAHMGAQGRSESGRGRERPIDSAVLEQLFRTYRKKVRLFFQRRGHDADVAEDLTQEVFLRLSTLSPQLLEERPQAMIFRVARFTSVDAIRKQMKNDGANDMNSAVELKSFAIVDGTPSAEQLLIWRDAIRTIQDLANNLPRRRAEAITLHRLCGWTQPEIAARQGVTLKTVEKQISAGAAVFDRRASLEARQALSA